MAKEKEAKKAISDVAKPGSTPPDSSGKPVIVSHKPMMKDPMVNEDEASDPEIQSDSADDSEKQSEKAPSEKNNRVIAPIVEDAPTDKADSEETEPETKEDSYGTADDGSESEESAVVDAVVSQAEDKKKKVKDGEDQEARRAEIEKLMNSKKYFVKVRSPKGKRNKRAILVVVLVVLLGLVGVGLAADAEIIPLNVPFDFIKKTQPAEVNVVVVSKPSEDTTESKSSTEPVEEKVYVAPEGWVANEAKNFGLSFSAPSDWTFVDHEENACSKGRLLDIVPSAQSISEAAATTNPELKKVKISLNKEADDTQNCGGISYYTSGIPIVEPAAEIETNWLKGNWLTFIGSEADAKISSGFVSSQKVEGQSYDVADDAETVVLGGKKVKIEVTFDKGTYEQVLDIATFESEAMKKTKLYTEILSVLNSFQEIIN